jgi:5-methylcytosine-specific restriction enzyme subunit McrC
MRDPICLIEGGDYQPEQLTPGQYVALDASGLVSVKQERGTYFVKDKQRPGVVGSVRVGTGDDAVEVRIKPKVPIKRLMFLIGYTRKPIDQIDWSDDEVDVGEAEGLLPAVAHAYARAAERGLRYGLLAGYREIETDATVMRGRIRETQQVREHYSFPLPIEVRYDDYTVDIPENQILLAATDRLLRLPDVSAPTRASLRVIRARMAAVSVLKASSVLPSWQRTRLNAHWHTALDLAELILRGRSYELGDGISLRADGLILQAWRIFEDFVTSALKAELDRLGCTCYQQDTRHYLTTLNRYRLEPDLVCDRPGPDGRNAPFTVIDAKYKLDGPERSDMHQVVTYCAALGLERGYVISPRTPTCRRIHKIRDSGITIVEQYLDLDVPPADVLRQIRDLAVDIVRPTPSEAVLCP